MAVNNCTFSGNIATGGAGGNAPNGPGNGGGNGGEGSGGGIYNLGALTTTVCTVSGNSGVGGAGGSGTVAGTAGPGTGGGLTNGGGSSTVRGTISAGNAGTNPDAFGTFISGGYNLIGNGTGSSGFGGTADQVGTSGSPINALLGPLQNNGGPTDTRALLTGSPAIDKGWSFGLTNDQRSRSRPLDNASIAPASGGDDSDIGAYESAGLLVPTMVVSRKMHGASPFDVDLTTTPAVECRSGGATADFQLVVTFPTAVTATGNPQASVTAGSGQIGTGGIDNGGIVTINGAAVTVPLTNVANAQALSVTLSGVGDGFNSNNVIVSAEFLIGDTNNDRSVNSADIAQTKSKSGQSLDATNFRSDVNVDGTFNSADIALVKSRTGSGLPSAFAGRE